MLAASSQKILEMINNEVEVAIIDTSGLIVTANDKFCVNVQYHKKEIVGQPYILIKNNLQPENVINEISQVLNANKVWSTILHNITKNDERYTENLSIIPLTNEEGIPYKYVSISFKLPDVKKEFILNDSFEETIKHLENTIFKYIETEDGRLVFTLAEGRTAEEIGFITEVIMNREISEFFPEKIKPIIEKNFRIAMEGKSNKFEMRLFETDFLVSLSPIIKDGQVAEVVGTALDITEQKEAEALVRYMAYHDSLTGLLNRAAFNEKITTVLQQSKEYGETFSLLFIDLDRFKSINDTFGHQMGDELLIKVSERLTKAVSKNDIIARLGGDEYAVLLLDRSKKETELATQQILKQVSAPFLFGNLEIQITPSIGISLFPQHGEDETTLLGNADTAMYYVKEQYRNNYIFFDEELKRTESKKIVLENDLRLALEKEQFSLFYQPQVNMTTKKVLGVEALIRWNHPKKGLVPPTEFIQTAEDTGLIIPIGEWVLRTACEQNKRWQEEGYEPIVMSVNVSPRQFLKSDFVDVVKQVLLETELEPSYLEIEITESMTMDQIYTEKVLRSLKELGVKISIDDFGTGYSSLHYLQKLPINKLKIDRLFMQESNDKSEAIIKTIISLAKHLNMDVIAEGVEMEEHIHFLKEQKCHQMQGYFFSKPLPQKEITDFLQNQAF